MYIPHHFAWPDEAELRALVADTAAGELITLGADGYPRATRLPLVWAGDRVLMHMARANPQWQNIEPATPALLVVSGAEAYVSPSFYPSKAEHGRVVPTWNYTAVHLTGRVHVHGDASWLASQVTALTDQMEAGRAHPWAVSDAPREYVEGQLKAIVGLELIVERVEGKAKLSQNRSADDRDGVIAGLEATGRTRDAAIAALMRSRCAG
jgi:transcriptional regulator